MSTEVVPTACYSCRMAHLRCDKERPCARCVTSEKACVDMEEGQRLANIGDGMQYLYSDKMKKALSMRMFMQTNSEIVPNSTIINSNPRTAAAPTDEEPGSGSTSNSAQLSSPRSAAVNNNSNRNYSGYPCAACRHSHVACDRYRACSRCARLGIQCMDQVNQRSSVYRPPPVPGEVDESIGQRKRRSMMVAAANPVEQHFPFPSNISRSIMYHNNSISNNNEPRPSRPEMMMLASVPPRPFDFFSQDLAPVAPLSAYVPPIDPRIFNCMGPIAWSKEDEDDLYRYPSSGCGYFSFAAAYPDHRNS